MMGRMQSDLLPDKKGASQRLSRPWVHASRGLASPIASASITANDPVVITACGAHVLSPFGKESICNAHAVGTLCTAGHVLGGSFPSCALTFLTWGPCYGVVGAVGAMSVAFGTSSPRPHSRKMLTRSILDGRRAGIHSRVFS